MTSKSHLSLIEVALLSTHLDMYQTTYKSGLNSMCFQVFSLSRKKSYLGQMVGEKIRFRPHWACNANAVDQWTQWMCKEAQQNNSMCVSQVTDAYKHIFFPLIWQTA